MGPNNKKTLPCLSHSARAPKTSSTEASSFNGDFCADKAITVRSATGPFSLVLFLLSYLFLYLDGSRFIQKTVVVILISIECT